MRFFKQSNGIIKGLVKSIFCTSHANQSGTELCDHTLCGFLVAFSIMSPKLYSQRKQVTDNKLIKKWVALELEW